MGARARSVYVCGEVCVCVEKCVYVWNPDFAKKFFSLVSGLIRGGFLYRGGWGAFW